MSEVEQILALGRRARAKGDALCLATVVHVEGSSYRKPGARMLISASGERAGTISGGCLEAEVCRKAWWLTAQGAHLERYSSFADEDGGMPYGLGCGGTVAVLLETGTAVEAILEAIEQGRSRGRSAVVVHSLGRGEDDPSLVPPSGTLAVLLAGRPAGPLSDTTKPGARRISGDRAFSDESDLEVLYQAAPALAPRLLEAAHCTHRQKRSCFLDAEFRSCGSAQASLESAPGGEGEALPSYFIEYLAAPPELTLFGAGDDAQPIAELAHALGWRVRVADGRAHLARRERFPHAAEVSVLRYPEPALRAACALDAGPPDSTTFDPADPGVQASSSGGAAQTDVWLPSSDLAILLTHSYAQDRALLTALLAREQRYLGILGPRHRTERLLAEVCPPLGMTIEAGFARLHSPVGLDLGAGEPAAVALSIIAEIQGVLHDRHVQVKRLGTNAIAPWTGSKEQREDAFSQPTLLHAREEKIANAPIDLVPRA